MEFNYGDVIKNIFEHKKKVNNVNKKHKKTFSLKSITSHPSEENFTSSIKTNIKVNNLKDYNNDENENEFRIINFDKTKQKELNLKKDSNIKENKIKRLIKNKEIKTKLTKGSFNLNTTDSNLENDKSSISKIKKNKLSIYSSKKNLTETTNFLESNSINKSYTNLIKEEMIKEKNNQKKKRELLNLKKSKGENEKRKNLNKFNNNKFEQYNKEAIAYESIKNFSHCKTNEKDFLKRMEFYSVKKQTKGKIINIIVNKAIRKIPEREKIIIFNRLIEDSNRRVEAKNRIELINNNVKIANELFDNESIIKKKKKFDQKKFEDNYQENIVNHLKKKERKLQLLREQKEQEEKYKEDLIVNEMKSRNRKAFQYEIDSISRRLYNDANNRKLKNELLRSSSENEKTFNTISDYHKNSFINHSKGKFKHKLSFSHIRSLSNYIDYNNNNNNSLNSNKISNKSPFSNIPIIDKMKYKNSNKEKKKYQDNRNNNNNNINIKKQFISFNNAEKMIDEFFTK